MLMMLGGRYVGFVANRMGIIDGVARYSANTFNSSWRRFLPIAVKLRMGKQRKKF